MAYYLLCEHLEHEGALASHVFSELEVWRQVGEYACVLATLIVDRFGVNDCEHLALVRARLACAF